MKIPVFILTAATGIVLALEAWTLTTLIQVRQDVAVIKATLHLGETAQR